MPATATSSGRPRRYRAAALLGVAIVAVGVVAYLMAGGTNEHAPASLIPLTPGASVHAQKYECYEEGLCARFVVVTDPSATSDEALLGAQREFLRARGWTTDSSGFQSPDGSLYVTLAPASGPAAFAKVHHPNPNFKIVDAVRDVAATGSVWRQVASIHTSSTGRFAYRTRPGASRTVRIRYPGEPTVRPSNGDVQVGVAAGSTVKVDRHRLRNGQTLHFSGRVHGPHLPAAKLVQVEALVNGHWQPFASTHANAKGQWARGYRFIGTRGTASYTFRILIPHETGFPFATGHTRAIRVRVHGP